MPLFETPGWSLPSSLLQSQPADPVQQDSSAPNKKKRKRKNKAGQEQKVSEENVADLWRQHVEGIAPSKPVPAPVPSAPQGTASDKTGNKRKANVQEDVATKHKKQKKEKQTQQPKAENTAMDEAGKTTKPAQLAKAQMPPPPPAAKPEMKLTPLQAAMRQKLISARFRHLNETLYTTRSAEAQALLDANPAFFEEYHSGFRQQVQAWPQNPVDGFVEDLQQRGKVKTYNRGYKGRKAPQWQPPAEGEEPVFDMKIAALPRTNGTCTVADLGCGDAKLASMVSGKLGKKLNIQVLSYDLQSHNQYVTKADISNLPLKDGSVDVAIFCLALMGTNWIDFIEEAWRVLHWKGELWVAEIKSRFGRPAQKRVDHSVGNRRKKPSKVDAQKQKEDDERNANQQLMVEVDGVEGKVQTDVTAFVEVLRRRGFALQLDNAIDMSNKMFVKMRFVKAHAPVKGKNVKESAGSTGAPVRQKPGFVEKEEEEDVDEASVLKPCLYKIR